MPRKIRDTKIQNSRYGKQKRLIEDLKEFVEDEPLIEAITIEEDEEP